MQSVSFLSLLSRGYDRKTAGAFPIGAVHCINLLYLCHKKKGYHPVSFLFYL